MAHRNMEAKMLSTSRQMTSLGRRNDAGMTYRRHTDVCMTSFGRHVPSGNLSGE